MPKSFKELKKTELQAAALAFGTEDEDSVNEVGVEALRAGLAESGVTWEQYAELFLQEEEAASNVITSEVVNSPVGDVDEVAALRARIAELEAQAPVVVNNFNEEPTIVTKEEFAPLSPNEQWLIRMTRANPLFEIAGHRFTQDHPYALMTAADAEVVLQEEGFRQARPSEVQEYYS